MTTDEAVKRQAGRDCLVRELSDALESVLSVLERHLGRSEALPGTPIAKARAALARAKEQQQ